MAIGMIPPSQWWIDGVGSILRNQWPLQEPKLEVPMQALCKGISLENMARNMVLSHLHFRILKDPLKK